MRGGDQEIRRESGRSGPSVEFGHEREACGLKGMVEHNGPEVKLHKSREHLVSRLKLALTVDGNQSLLQGEEQVESTEVV